MIFADNVTSLTLALGAWVTVVTNLPPGLLNDQHVAWSLIGFVIALFGAILTHSWKEK